MSRAVESVESTDSGLMAAGPAGVGGPAGRFGAVLLAVAGASMAAGGILHPHGSGDTVDEALGGMLASPLWNLSHLLVLAGLIVGIAGFVLLRRSHVLGAPLRRWLTLVIVTWSLAAVETVPHLLAGGEHAAHVSGGPTPMTDAHVLLSTVTTPLLAIVTALFAIQLARQARTVVAWVLTGFAVLGAVTFGAASPLLAITANPAVSALFPGQLFIDVWLIGTAIRLLRPGRRSVPPTTRPPGQGRVC